MEAPDHHIIPGAEVDLELVDGIVSQILYSVGVTPESRFVSDDEIHPGGVRALELIESRHKGGGDALDVGIGAAGLESIAVTLLVPRKPEILLDAVDYVSGSHAKPASNRGLRQAATGRALREPASSATRRRHSSPGLPTR